MNKKLIAIALSSITILSLVGCGHNAVVNEKNTEDIHNLETTEVVEEEVKALTDYPDHILNEIKVVTGTVSKAEEENAEPYEFTYFGNDELGYGVLPKGFEKINDTSYSYKVDEGEIFFTIDGYKKGDYSFDDWVSFIKTSYDGETNFQEENVSDKYVCYTFNPKEDLSAVTFLEISDDDEYIHICIITVDNCDPEIISGFYPYGHFDYEPITFLEELGDIKINETVEE